MDKVKNSEAYFKSQEIETFIGLGENNSSFNKEGDMVGERRKLLILHQNGEDKKSLIGQLQTLIHGLETNFEAFAG